METPLPVVRMAIMLADFVQTAEMLSEENAASFLSWA